MNAKKISDDRYRLLHVVLLVFLVINFLIRAQFIFANRALLGFIGVLGGLLGLAIGAGFIFMLIKKYPSVYMLLGLVFGISWLRRFLSGEIWDLFRDFSLGIFLKNMPSLIIAVLAIYIWGKYYKFQFSYSRGKK